MRFTLTFPLLLSALVLAACSTTVIDDSRRVVQDGQTPFTGDTMEMDPAQSFIAFTGKSNLITHEGEFTNFVVDAALDPENPSDFTRANVEVLIDVASVETDAAGLTAHLKREDFFDAEQYPVITFRSTSIMATGGNTYQISGSLTIKDVTLPATFDAVLTDASLVATYSVPRQAFGIGNDSYGDKLLEPLVPVEVQVVFRR
jgi:polyisoprenoid-binding protein YceI